MAKLPRLPRSAGPRGTKVGRGGKTSKQRLKKLQRRRMRRDFTDRMLKNFGLGDYASAKNKENDIADRKRLGIFGEAVKKKVKKEPDLPSMIDPETVAKETSPSVSSIVTQLEALLKTSNKIGILSKKQQEALVEQITQAKRIAKEQQMESGPDQAATLEPTEGLAGANITPLNDILQELLEKISGLTDVVDEKVKEQEEEKDVRGFGDRLLENLGLGDYAEARRKEARNARDTLNKGYKADRGKGGKVRYRNAKGQFAKQTDAIAGKKPGILSRAGGAIKSGASGLVQGGKKVVGAAAGGIGSMFGSSKLAGAIGAQTGRAAAKGGAAKVGVGAIKKLAKPIIAKALGSSVIKSIPIVGAVAGLGFAAKRLLEGDIVGAGLDAASGLGGPLTAIPALVASTARDVYTNVFGIPPEQDPMAAQRMGMVTSGVKAVVEETLKGGLQESGATPTGAASPAAQPPSDIKIPQAEQTQAPTVSGSGPPLAPSQSMGAGEAPGGGGGGGAPAEEQKKPTPTGGSSSVGTVPGAGAGKESGAPSAAPASNENPYPQAEDALKQKTEPTVGAAIAEASQLNENLASGAPSTQVNGLGVPKPATSPTTKPGAVGMGNVPDPTYGGMGDIFEQLYFGAKV